MGRGGGRVRGGVGHSKNRVTWEAVPKFLLLHSLYVCGKSKVSFITFRFFSLLSWPSKVLIKIFIVLQHCIICIFLIHSDSQGFIQAILMPVRQHIKLNILTEFSNSIFTKCYFKACWHRTCIQNKLVYYVSSIFKLFF